MQRSFSSGEIAPSLQSRADLSAYTTGLNLCENFIVKAQGGAVSRPGLRYSDEVGDSAKVARLIPFSVGVEETYILVFEDLTLRFIQDGAYVMFSGSPYEIVTTYTEAMLFDLDYSQEDNVMTIVSAQVPQTLTRTTATSWALSAIDFSEASSVPYPILANSYLTGSTVTNITQANPAVVTTALSFGPITGSPVDMSGVVGMTEVNGRSFTITKLTATTFELNGEDSTGHTAYASAGTATAIGKISTTGTPVGAATVTNRYIVTQFNADGIESFASDTLEITTAELTNTFAVRIGISALYASSGNWHRIYKSVSPHTDVFAWIGDTYTGIFDDFNIAPDENFQKSDYYEPFGVSDNPAAVAVYQQRMVFGGGSSYARRLNFSKVGDYNSMNSSPISRDDDSIELLISSGVVNQIRHIIPLDSLVVLTSGGEWVIGDGRDRVLTPSTISARQESYSGASKIKPVVVNNTILFGQEKGKKIREFSYNTVGGDHINGDISLTAEHLFKTRSVVSMAYAAEPYGVLWCVMDDGVMLGLTYQKEHQVLAWHKHVTNGSFESVAVITENDRDSVYVTVKRTINGATKRYIERLEEREETLAEDCFYVDSGLSYDGSAATVFSGLGHLEGEGVSILADGYEVTGKTVTGGSVTLDRAASKVHIGLVYTPAMETLDIDSGQLSGGLKSKSLSVSKVVIEVEDSRGGWVGARQDPETSGSTTYREIKPRFISDSYDPVGLKTYKAEVTIDPQWSKGGGVRIEQRAPLPLSILSIIPRVDVGGN